MRKNAYENTRSEKVVVAIVDGQTFIARSQEELMDKIKEYRESMR